MKTALTPGSLFCVQPVFRRSTLLVVFFVEEAMIACSISATAQGLSEFYDVLRQRMPITAT
jgi:hypothetical protein